MEWISVNDKLPRKNKKVLCYKYSSFYASEFLAFRISNDKNDNWILDSNDIVPPPTHWMPLPEPPKE